MSTERLNRIIEEVESLTPDDRRRLLERLEQDNEQSTPDTTVRRPGTLKGTVKYMAPDFDAPPNEFKEYIWNETLDRFSRTHMVRRSTSTTLAG